MDECVHGPPQARDQRLFCRELPDGLMVYDAERHQAHSLNRTAALVWRHCDGRTSVSHLAGLLEQELNLPPDEEVVWLALDRLEKAHLLQGRLSRPAAASGITRRHVIRKLGRVGAVAALVPLVASVSSPAAAQAASPAATKAQCISACNTTQSSCQAACAPTGPTRGPCLAACASAHTACVAAC
jgi:Coenzyme PQQ synthesis protein D (PqqD)